MAAGDRHGLRHSDGPFDALWGDGRATLPSSWPSVSDNALATAPAPPRLVTKIRIGEPVSVLYMTRPDDQVLVRCYPGYVPGVNHRAMGANPEADTVPQEGVLRCAVPSDLPQIPHRPTAQRFSMWNNPF